MQDDPDASLSSAQDDPDAENLSSLQRIEQLIGIYIFVSTMLLSCIASLTANY